MQQIKELLEYPDNVSCKWNLAWGQLDFYCMGRSAWSFPDYRESVRAAEMHRKQQNGQGGKDSPYLSAYKFCVDIFQNA